MKSSLDRVLGVPTARRDRRWLSLALRKLLWSAAVGPMLEEMGCGWCDGGCHSCAQGIRAYLEQAGPTHPVRAKLAIIADARAPAQHVVACLSLAGQKWYLDANGVFDEKRLLRYWAEEEGLLWPRIEEDYDAGWLDEEIPCNGRMSAQVTALLQRELGAFNLAWLGLSRKQPAEEAEARPVSHPSLPTTRGSGLTIS